MMLWLEATRIMLIYIHLIACCVSIGAILTHDIRILTRLYSGQDEIQGANFHDLKWIITIMLAILWITGLLIIGHDSFGKDWTHTLSNPKLQAKLIVVSLLSMNGIFLHYRILPMLSKVGSLFKLTPSQRLWAIWAGVLSGVSWLYAVFLGAARPLAWKTPLSDFVPVYLALTMLAFIGMWTFTTWVAKREHLRPSDLPPSVGPARF